MTAILLMLLGAPAVSGVALAPSSCDTELVKAVRDELHAAGFSFAPPDDPSAIAQLRLNCTQGSLEARIEDRVTRKAVERQLSVAPGLRREAQAAVQVVELLHASLAEARFDSMFAVPIPKEVDRFLAEQEPGGRWATGLLAGALFSPGGFGVEPTISGFVSRSVFHRSGWRLEVGGSALATIRASRLRGEGGSAEVGLLHAAAVVAVPLELGEWTLRPHLGVGALFAWASGHAEALYQPASGVTATFAPCLGLSLLRNVAPWMALSLGAEATGTPIPIRIQFPDVTTLIGAPLFSASVGVAFR